jgi:GTP-binding protein
MSIFQHATFFTTVNHLRDLPAESSLEIAFAGRSNAGKSSALNRLARQNRLAFVSKMPGRTQHINYFSLGGSRFLVDLPGYGYAKVPEEIRAHWGNLLSIYLATRQPLYGLVLIMDVRHPLTPLDVQMLGWFWPTGKPVHILLTKADKLSKNEAAKTLHKVKAELEKIYPGATVQLFSSLKLQGIEEAENILATWLGEPPTEKENKKPPVKGE